MLSDCDDHATGKIRFKAYRWLHAKLLDAAIRRVFAPYRISPVDAMVIAVAVV